MKKEERKFIRRLTQSEKPIIFDGAMGTLLHEHGVDIDECFDELNLLDPAAVGEIHRNYIAAGAEVIKTNTLAQTEPSSSGTAWMTRWMW